MREIDRVVPRTKVQCPAVVTVVEDQDLREGERMPVNTPEQMLEPYLVATSVCKRRRKGIRICLRARIAEAYKLNARKPPTDRLT